MILLDTDVSVAYLRGVPRIVQRMSDFLDEDLRIPAMSAAELFYGAEKSGAREESLARLDEYLSLLPVLQTDMETLRAFGSAKALHSRAGLPIPDADLLIGCAALAHGCPLATGNARHLSRIPGIQLLFWFDDTPQS